MESDGDAVVEHDLAGAITSWNETAARFFGCDAEQAIGRSIRLILHPDQQAQDDAVLERVRGGEVVEGVTTVRLGDAGAPRAMALQAAPLKDNEGRVTGVRRVFRALRLEGPESNAQALLAAIVQSSDDAIVSKTLDGIVTSWNRAAERIFGYSAEEAIGRSITLIIPPDRIREEEGVLARLRKGEIIDHFETVRRRKDGSLVDVSLTVSPVKDGRGRVIGASKVARDVSARREIERDREQLLEESQRTNRAKDQFLAMLSHELRNPLGAISSAVRLLQIAGGEAHTAQLARDVITRQTRQLTRLVDDLLDVTRVTTGKIVLARQALDLAEVVKRCVDTLRTAGKLEHHQLTVRAASVWVWVDPTRLDQVIDNLLGNALKYTAAGGSVTVQVEAEGEAAVLHVEDSGVGIPKPLQSQIFELFVQGETSLDRGAGGLGIGLTLVRRLVELHGGSVEAFSDGPGCGSRFTVRLPSLPRPAGSRPGRGASEPVAAAVRRRVLLVEDNKDSRETLQQILELSGHEVHEAQDGRQAVEMALELRPDVALVDLGLPDLDGFEVARRIRAGEGDRRLMLVALTGYGSDGDRAKTRKAGFDLHLVKPVDPERLAAIFDQLPG
jgi:PAS domain S-box-containing protein